MSFSRAQQPEFRKLVAAAWAAHCRHEGSATASPRPDRAWYEAHLEEATGHSSTSDCNAGRDYDLAMAHFEALAGAEVKWNLRVFSGDANRMLHEIHAVSAGHEDLDERYLRGVAKRMLQREDLPVLHTLSREVLIRILGEVKRWVRQKLKRGGFVP